MSAENQIEARVVAWNVGTVLALAAVIGYLVFARSGSLGYAILVFAAATIPFYFAVPWVFANVMTRSINLVIDPAGLRDLSLPEVIALQDPDEQSVVQYAHRHKVDMFLFVLICKNVPLWCIARVGNNVIVRCQKPKNLARDQDYVSWSRRYDDAESVLRPIPIITSKES